MTLLLLALFALFHSTQIAANSNMDFSPSSDSTDIWSRNRYLDMQNHPSQPCPRRNAIVEIPSNGEALILPRNDLSMIPSNTAKHAQTTTGTGSSTETTGDPTFFSSVVTSDASESVAVETGTFAHSGTATGTGEVIKETNRETGSAVRERVEMVVVLLVGVAFAVTMLL